MAQIMVEYDGVDDGGGRSDDFNVTFQVTRWCVETVHLTFYLRLSRIAVSLTSMLKTSGSTESTTRPKKGGVEVGGDNIDDSSHNEEHSPRGSRRMHQQTRQV